MLVLPMVSPRRNTLLTFNCGVRSFRRFVSRFCHVFQKVRTDPGRTGNQEGRHFPSYRPCPQEEGGSGGVLAPIDQGEAQQELGQDRFLQGKITDIISSWLKC